MERWALVGLLIGYIWGATGVVGYPGVSWKPGAILTVVCALWLVAHKAMPAKPLVEALAILIVLGLMFARPRLFPDKREEKTKGPGTG